MAREYMQFIDCDCRVCEDAHNEGNKKDPQIGFELILLIDHNPRFAVWYDGIYNDPPQSRKGIRGS